jgi:CRP-like cAMP-binding protein
MREVALLPEQQILDVGEPPDHLVLPGAAVLSVVTVMGDGDHVETSTVGFESAPGLLAHLTDAASPTRCFTQGAGSAIKIASAAVRAHAQADPRFMQILLRFALANTAQADLTVACNALHDAPMRLARWLLLTQDRVGRSIAPLTQDLLSVMLGVQRTTVTKVAMIFKADGVIDYSRGRIPVVERERLERSACKCYAAGSHIAAEDARAFAV